ncbi:hypothetical protein GF337_13205 [candidate division KSB1 bacterium]|nr:hypothetical protein [candidate division KSB1 bacterium]
MKLIRIAEYSTLCRFYLASNQSDQVLQLIDKTFGIIEAEDWTYFRLDYLLLRAIAHKMLDEHREAVASLKEALAIGERGSFIRIFIDFGQPMLELLQSIYNELPSHSQKKVAPFSRKYIKKLIKAFDVSAVSRMIKGLVEPLSKRELEVLKLIAAGFTNQEIGEQLFISLNTVRTHTKKINYKLDVHNRTQAISKAKELGIL